MQRFIYFKCTYILFHCSQTGCLQSSGWLFDDSPSQESSLQQLILEWWCALNLFGGIHSTIVNCFLASASVNNTLPLSSLYQIFPDIHCHLLEKSQSSAAENNGAPISVPLSLGNALYFDILWPEGALKITTLSSCGFNYMCCLIIFYAFVSLCGSLKMVTIWWWRPIATEIYPWMAINDKIKHTPLMCVCQFVT
jgi:hypothetical protein